MIPKTCTGTVGRALPAELAMVAQVDAKMCAAAGGMSVSWWHEEVRAGRAPAPVVQQARCTRWKLADVVRFWRERSATPLGREAVVAKAKKASMAAKAKRQAAQGAHA